jgi:hypothetical protein
VQTALKALIDDHGPQGKQHCLNILRNVPKEVIRAIVDNTIGHRYATDPSFRELIPETDESAGVYLNTFVDKATGKGLNSNQWNEMVGMMGRYLSSEDVIINENSTPEQIAEADEAAAIERACNPRHRSLETFKESTYAGTRVLRQPLGNTADTFHERLAERVCLDLDPYGLVSQLQSPVQVGCAINLGLRMMAYDRVGGMESVPKTWGLLMSCLFVMGVDVQHVSIIILQIWEHDQLTLAETLLTLLGSPWYIIVESTPSLLAAES